MNRLITCILLLIIGLATCPMHAADLPALHKAVLQSDMQRATALLEDEKANNPNKRDQLGSTPLHLAVRADNLEMAQLLLEHHANGNLTDGRGQTAMDMAKGWSMWWLLLRHGALPGVDTSIFLIATGLLFVLGLSVWLRKVKADAQARNLPDAYLTEDCYMDEQESEDQEDKRYHDAA
ncbi:MAG: ankyrin repeat domain-containing protein [Phycisphaeraceae bacterium JB051]